MTADSKPDKKPDEQPTATEQPAQQAQSSLDADSPPPEPTMRAVVLTGYGGLKSVKVLNKPQPSPPAGHVLVRVRAG